MSEQCEGCERDLREDEGHETEDMVMLCDECWQECENDPACHSDECRCDKCKLLKGGCEPMAERITKERLEAFAGWDAPKYSTGVHPNIVEIKKMAAELLAYRESGARESLRKIKQQGEPQRGRDELWSLWRSRVAVWEEACESLERLEAIEK